MEGEEVERDEETEEDVWPQPPDKAARYARGSLVCGAIVWLSQGCLSLIPRHPDARIEGAIIAACFQLFFLLAGLALGSFALSELKEQGRKDPGIRLRAILGMLISGGTLALALIGFFMAQR